MSSIIDVHVTTVCDGCPDSCCSQPYDWVYLTQLEIDALSEASGLAPDEFVTVRVNPATGFRFNVLELPCQFYVERTGRCSVYDRRPLVCRLYPLYVDPMSGDGMLLAAQCGDRLDVLDARTMISWSLRGHANTIREWVQSLWSEATRPEQRNV